MAAFSSGEAIQYPYLATMPRKVFISSGVGGEGFADFAKELVHSSRWESHAEPLAMPNRRGWSFDSRGNPAVTYSRAIPGKCNL